MKKQGFAIILVLATLVLLAMLSLTYIKLALIDRNIARNYMDNKRAKLIAQSGVDYAVARVQEDFFGTGWVYKDDLNPSFASGTIKIGSKIQGYTSKAGSSYSKDGDLFVLKIADANSKINVNDGLNNPRVTENIRRILDALGDVAGIAALGFKIINARSPSGYSNSNELLRALTQTQFDKIKDFVTTHAWQDDTVANPVPLSSDVLSDYPVKYNGTRYGRGINAYGSPVATSLKYTSEFVDGQWKFADPKWNGHGIYGLDELNPQWIEIVSRSPVNINHANEKVLTALLKDLRGIFAADRRSLSSGMDSIPWSWASCYNIDSSHQQAYDYGPDLSKDEVGLLYSTEAITQQLATDIAKAIKACRTKSSVTIGSVTIDYSDAAAGPLWFRGPFKTWRQFNRFIDDLVEKGVIKDSRSDIYIDYHDDQDSSNGTNFFPTSPVALKIAHQAKGDCLKANFNPNLHLNETNPDANIATLVDKTDLIVNSTEFCFTPMGYFQIESEGYILKSNASDNIVIAGSKITTITRLYDAIRQTNQKQFLAGLIPNAAANTNNGKTLEIGPEPAIVDEVSARENEWGGYIALPTLKGPSSGTGIVLRGHYTDKFSLDYHVDAASAVNLTDKNVADKTEGTTAGPYRYNARYRLARSYRQDDTITSLSYAPCDLRVDGVYIERHAGLAYTVSQNVLQDQGSFCYWVKPWFHPGNTDSPRTFLTIGKYLGNRTDGYVAEPGQEIMFFGNFFIPPYQGDTSLYALEADSPVYGGSSYGFYRESSFFFGYSTVETAASSPEPPPGGGGPGPLPSSYYYSFPISSSSTWVSPLGGYGKTTQVLNHSTHGDGAINYLKRGQWVHIICRWDFPVSSCQAPSANPPSATQTCLTKHEYHAKIWINGKEFAGTSYLLKNHGTGLLSPDHILNFSNRLRIGEASLVTNTPEDYDRNWTCDSTVDEFYFIAGTDTTTVSKLYTNSRYFRPSSGQTCFNSRQLELGSFNKEQASESTIANPSGLTAPSVNNPDYKLKIIGLSWTWYPEEVVKNTISYTTGKGNNATTVTVPAGTPIMKDYRDYDKTWSSDPATLIATFLYPKLKIKLIKNDDESILPDVHSDDSFSSLDIDLTATDQIQYKVIMDIEGIDTNNSVLLYSPIFDDITIYYQQQVCFLSYTEAE